MELNVRYKALSRVFLAFLITAFSFAMKANAEDITASGMVVDANGEPLLGITVLLEGTAIGTATDMD